MKKLLAMLLAISMMVAMFVGCGSAAETPAASGALKTGVIVMVVAVIIGSFILNKTYFGRNIYALGSNPDAVALSGVSVAKMRILIFALAGVFFGIGQVVNVGTTGGAVNQGLGIGAEFTVMAGGFSVSSVITQQNTDSKCKRRESSSLQWNANCGMLKESSNRSVCEGLSVLPHGYQVQNTAGEGLIQESAHGGGKGEQNFMEIIQLKYFATVARLGNVSKAARELYVTQPNLSKSIARLEDELGVPLFEHRKGKIVLNDYGRCFLSSVNLCLEELENGVRSIQRIYESTQNILALGSSIDDLLPDVLRSFAQQHPEIGIRQFDCSVPELYERISRRTLDLAITARPMGGDGFVFESLGRSEFVILVGKDHPFAGRKTISVRELAGEKLICDRSRMDSGTLSELCRSHGFTPNIVFEVESSNLIYSLLSCNRGVAFMPMVQMRKINHDFPNSGIHMIRIADKVEPAQLGIVYRRDYDWSQAATTFADFLRKWLGQEAEEVRSMECITDEA